MAFGRDDTDAVYDNLIEPTLRTKGIVPIRVDRIEHIDDIDDRIIAEIEKCDFALADLTYARPSVYFESGFAERKVSVIYTCRKDHLTPKPDDEFGNFRIHFDLQMKNIVAWSDPSDRRFANRLGKRIAFLAAPLLRDKQAKEKERIKTAEFASLSLEDKTDRVLKICAQKLKRAGFRGTTSGPLELSQWFHTGRINPLEEDSYRPYTRIIWTSPGWFGTRLVHGTMQAIFVHVTPSLVKKQILSLYKNILRSPVYSISCGKKQIPKRLVEHLLVCSFEKTTVARVMEALPHFSLDRTNGELVWSRAQDVPKHKIAGYDELYVDPTSFMHHFIVRSPRKRDEQALELRGRRLLSADKRKLGWVKKVRRHVHIRLLHVQSETVLERSVSDILTELR
jgi:hypothetical protein